ncbi:C1 domain-containing protein [Halopelagius longus]|uniref:Zinc ribbon domain-containing protein n=1 Tax=Halopelagius longus TaxID=1236180 RepID=A0A1H1FYV1_9EURY|nr:zinc ribbon domain-containing protein [Halopelagius longus]RDI69947.1 zinc ribbon domain-containing protein [Halopelagius longus]SDR06095.1 hypothetical protein SAMN05216278_3407 [Halopelagius longus]
MAAYQCSACGETVPRARRCVECGAETDVDCAPSEDAYLDGLTRRLSEQAAAADHDSVSFDAVRSDYDVYDRPLGGYLYPEERPMAVFGLGETVITSFTEDSWTVKAGLLKSGHLLVTEDRLLSVTPDAPTTQLVPVDFADVVAIERESSWLDSVLSVELADGYTYEYHLERTPDEEMDAALALLRELSDGRSSAETEAARFVRDVDDVVAAGNSAETVLRDVADLFAERDEETVFDHLVAEADSVDELFVALSNAPNVGPPAGEATSEDEREGEDGGALPVRRSRFSNLRHRVAYTAQNADPAEVGKYTLAAGFGFGAAAVSAPISTPVGLAAIAAGGAATGAYASAHPDSLAARIDPIALALSAKTAGRRLDASPVPAGAGTGAALGAIEHLGDEAVPAEYAHWFAEADFDAIVEGAELAAREAARSEAYGDRNRAAIVGGGVGLASGYVDDATLDELEGLLDDDLYEALLPADESEETEPDGRD